MKKLLTLALAVLSAAWLTGCSMNSGSSNVKISIEKAKEIALKQANVAQNDVIKMDVEDANIDNIATYEIDFETNGRKYEYHIDQLTGDILVTKVREDRLSSSDQTRAITQEEAELLAFTHAKTKREEVTDLETKAEVEDGINVYAVSFDHGQLEYEYKIVKDTAQIMKYEVENRQYKNKTNTPHTLTLEEASTKALSRVKGATKQHLTIKADVDDGKAIYEGEIYYNNKKYEFEIDATTGNFVEWEEEVKNVNNTVNISKEEASDIALKKVPGASQSDLSIELDEEDGILIYEGEIHHHRHEYEFEIDANSGDIISWEKEGCGHSHRCTR